MAMDLDEIDRIGLIKESYRIEGISEPECRSIFLDWALKLPDGIDQHQAIKALLAVYGDQADHPMTQVLTAGLDRPTHLGRRGGRRARTDS
jgi:hypothetical protein